jgi:hypothetical protein
MSHRPNIPTIRGNWKLCKDSLMFARPSQASQPSFLEPARGNSSLWIFSSILCFNCARATLQYLFSRVLSHHALLRSRYQPLTLNPLETRKSLKLPEWSSSRAHPAIRPHRRAKPLIRVRNRPRKWMTSSSHHRMWNHT